MTDERQLEHFRQELQAAQLAGAAAVDRFFAGLAGDPAERGTLVEFALQLAERLTEDDGFLVADGSRRLLLAYAGPEQADRVRALRAALPALPGWRDYRADFDELAAVLEGRGQGVCDCVVRASFRPCPRESGYEVLAVTPDSHVLGSLIHVRCAACGSEWNVEEDLSYHYPLYYWHRATASA